MTKFCKSRVPEDMVQRFEKIKDDEAAVKELGVEIGYEIAKRILEIGAPGVHFYTLNLANTTVAIVNRLRSEGVLPPTLADVQATVVVEVVAAQAVSATASS
jgi:5,10-methylenetetrahydrofolate reductase